MTNEQTLRRVLAFAVAVVAVAGIVAAGVVANPAWADEAALERAEVVHSPAAHRLVTPTAADIAPPAPVELTAPAPGPVPADPDLPAPAAAPIGAPARSPAPAPAPAAPAPAPVAQPAPAPQPADRAASRVGTRDAACEASMHRWMNETRAGVDRHALTWDDAILHVAVDWSDEMAGRGELAHNPGYGERVFAARPEATTAAENVGWGTGTARAVYDEFLRSPSHKDKILSGALTHTAVGCVRDGAGELWVTVNFWG